jgi:hypothetical protein
MNRKLFFVFILFLTACAMGKISFYAPRASTITIPPRIKTIVLTTRTAGGSKTIQSLFINLDTLSNYTLQTVYFDTSLKNEMPPPLDWGTIDLMTEHDSTAVLVSLEARLFRKKTEMVNTSKGTDQRWVYYQRYCWRIYEPATRSILDSNTFEVPDMFILDNEGRAFNIQDRYAGKIYSLRILPRIVATERYYFRKGNSQMKKADKLVRDLHLDPASVIWKQQSESPNKKVARRACYNLAVYYEFKGDPDEALEWAERSKSLGEKKAGQLIPELKQHKRGLLQFGNQPLRNK